MDAGQIDAWYGELDETRNGQVGGAKIVKFLMGSALPKDILRTIWELGDSDKRGYVDRAQFARMIRLVSVAQRPGFVAPPTMDQYYASVRDVLPLPAFGDEHAKAPSLPTPPSVAVQIFKSVDDAEMPRSEGSDDEDFDDFVAPDQPAVVPVPTAIPPSNITSIKPLKATNAPGMHMPVIIGMSAFDTFGDLEDAPVVALQPLSLLEAMTTMIQKPDEDEEFGEFGDHDSEKIPNTSSAPAPARPIEDDDFGDFNSSPRSNGDDNDEFGNFGSADTELKINISAPILAVKLATLPVITASGSNDNLDAFGDFGDFEESTAQTQHIVPVVNNPIIGSMDIGSMPSLVSGQTSSDDTDDFGDFGGFDETFAPPSPKNAPPPLPDGILPVPFRNGSIPNNNILSPRHSFGGMPSPPPLPQHSPRNSFGGVPGLGPSPMTTPLSSPRNSINLSSPFDLLSLGASPRNSLTLSSPNNNDAISSLFDGLNSASPVSPNPGTAADGKERPMNIRELEKLAVGLKEKNQLEAGYAAAAQMAYRRRMKELAEDKVRAIEDDDLETALNIKKSTNVLAGLLAPLEEEKKWVAALGEPEGESISEMVKLVETAFSRTLGKGCKCLYILRSPFSDLADELRFLYLGKRCIRLIITVHTTHAALLPAWSKMAAVITDMLQKALGNQIQAFKELCAADKAEVKSSQRMTVFIAGIIAIAETGLHVAASLLNTLSTTEEAETLEAAAYAVLGEAQLLWGARSDLLELQSKGRVLKESGTDVPLGAPVIYCNLTLRPIGVLSAAGVIVPLPGHGEKVPKIVIVDTPRGDAHYMANALQFYKRNISPNLPEIDCPFPGFI